MSELQESKQLASDQSIPNLFNPEYLRLSQDFISEVGGKKILISVPIRKPDSQVFIRVHPDDAFYLETTLLELKEERETYLVDPSLRADLSGEIVPKALYTCLTPQGTLFLWPVKLPSPDGRLDSWNSSAHRIAKLAKTQWVRVVSNRQLQGYEPFAAVNPFSEPEWLDLDFQAILQLAFQDRIIQDPNHPVLKKLRGEQ
ncbi:MAG: hypothetical protein KC643_21075 [Nitrospira sp.]|nr:hypothetical protein [Nitrospira sp.]